jgi:PIN domain nuclease of toxin-antitoxin system
LIESANLAGHPIALDSSALISFLEQREPYASLLIPLIDAGSAEILLSSVAIAEALVLPARLGGLEVVEQTLRAILALPSLRTIALDDDVAAMTAVVRARTGLKLPDAAIVAAALIGDAHALIGNDRVWKNRGLGVPYHHLDDILATE